jgi:hypothetical protein
MSTECRQHTEERLEDLADEIQLCILRPAEGPQEGISQVREMGRILAEARRLLPGRKWKRWIERRVPCSLATAAGLVYLHANWAQLRAAYLLVALIRVARVQLAQEGARSRAASEGSRRCA